MLYLRGIEGIYFGTGQILFRVGHDLSDISRFLKEPFLLVDISTSFGENLYANCHSCVTGSSI